MKEEEKQKNYELAERLLSEQNFTAAVIAGAVATLLSAVAYGITVTYWDFSFGFAAAAVVVAMLVITVGNPPPVDETAYIEIAELLETTYWSAPSDVLLPEREFDIYQELPVLFESTEPAEGALL